MARTVGERHSRGGVETLHDRIEARTARIAVIGCGYVGLPLSMAFADAGFSVLGLDIDESRVRRMREGKSHIMDVSDALIAGHVRSGRFTPTCDYDELRSVDVIFVSVPTPFDRARQPDLSFIISAAEQIAQRLCSGQLVVLESTTFPGTTDEVLKPILERSGLVAGTDFHLAFSPERIDPGNTRFRIDNTPKVVGGIDAASTEIAALALQQVIPKGEVRQVSSARAAELTKLLENTFRAVNIALVNELAMLCDRMHIDIWEVIDAAATKPYGFMPFYPGPGVGGHCISVDPHYLSWKAREYDFHTKFIELAAERNLEMPFFVASRVRSLLNRFDLPLHRARLAILGASFKANIDDARNSASIRVMDILRAEGAKVEYHDPYVGEVRLSGSLYGPEAGGVGAEQRLRSAPLTPEWIASSDCVVVLVAHSSVDYPMVLENATLVFDAVNATRSLRGKAFVERL